MLDDELRALVSVDAPGGFPARVQATIAARQARTASSHIRRSWLVPVAATTAIVIAAWLNARVEKAVEVEVLRPQRTEHVAPLVPPIESQPSAIPFARVPLPVAIAHSRVDTAVLPARFAAVQFDAAEGRALRALFASAPPIAIVTIVPPEDAPIVIPRISIEPLRADDSPEGERR